jgi:hypothetical protein
MERSAAVMERLLNYLRECPQDNGKLERELAHTNENIAELRATVERYNAGTTAACKEMADCLTQLKQIAARGEQWRADHESLHGDVLNPKLATLEGNLNVWKGINAGLSALFAAIAGLISSTRQ